ncbi:ATP-binding cassette domain-containing protein [Zhihengliuella salsuginis]|uniref:Mycobactin import ATP-binding/permease protein IrtA n=1 Tax=Zhihengliuella salsuginis TaxID=578222 RepID=A0ABQ3GEK5_9MICC|nr:SIP domain-containing protein [Zhihengliuella salsuginis]GHD02341.1 cobalamin ABC transporter ATP-binding protein [Zhihengliuella salsuginis]
MAQLTARSLSLGYDKSTIVADLSLELPAGEVTMIVGANGCGKSTLLRGMSRLLKPSGGSVVLDGKDIHAQPAREIAKVLGLLPQTPIAPDGITVRELVGRGRYPHQGWFRRWSSEDDDAVARAMHATGTEELSDRPIDELSGGQRQRVWIAMALAQETDLLLLDEPTTYLDVAHQLEVLDVVADLNRRRNTTVAIVLHDLNLAARYADHLVALKDGEIYAQGHPAAVVTETMVHDVFGMPSRVIPDPVAGTPLVLPIGRNRVVRDINHDENAARAAAGRPTGTLPPVPAAAAAGEGVRPADGDDRQSGGDGVVPAEGAGLRPALEACPTLAYTLTAVAATTLSPSYRRVTFTGEDLAHFGTGGHPLDLRIKLVIPGEGGGVDHFAALRPDGRIADADVTGWYRNWLQIDPAERGWLRTYSIRSFRPAGHPGNMGGHAEIDVDFVLHVKREDGRLVGGPASVWAATAEPGDTITMLGPNANRCGPDYAGIEFRPGSARRILLAGDETAAPAICSILETLPPGMTGNAFIEVPTVDDIQGSFTRSGVSVQWLPRGSNPHGEMLDNAVRSAVAIPAAGAVVAGREPEDIDVDETILWETAGGGNQPFYAWLAGEAGTIKELRRYLVRDAGMNRKQVSFMGYWRRGKSEM